MDEAIQLKKKLEGAAILKDFQAMLAKRPRESGRWRIQVTTNPCAATWRRG